MQNKVKDFYKQTSNAALMTDCKQLRKQEYCICQLKARKSHTYFNEYTIKKPLNREGLSKDSLFIIVYCCTVLAIVEI